MNKIEEYLSKIDLKEKSIIYAIPIVLFLAFSFMYLIPILKESNVRLDEEINNINNMIKIKSPEHMKNKINQVKNRLMLLEKRYQDKKDNLLFLYSRLTNLENMEFDTRKWPSALDSILKKTIKLNIKIKEIKNITAKKRKKSSIVAKKYVEISGKGYYSQIIKFIAFLEDSNYLIDIKNIIITKSIREQKVNFTLNFTIYGVTI